MTKKERLTAEELVEIKMAIEYYESHKESGVPGARIIAENLTEKAVPKLLAEVERLRFALESIVNIDGKYLDTEFDVEDAYDTIDKIALEAIRND
ncbi:hypothetical protein GJU41_11730 [Bacillus idriensis]|uniref:Uncharacterized protein n=1 Tax=Metabacillus idriensis TaxID=324768 RepID=A0A6I2MBH8_9BACI|nr:hypothetical protein [Metabacillus idriensis]MRX54642.1 hypothetical protein [Metabacillus idriensis]